MELQEKAARVKLLLTDCDGVLTDSGVYYSPNGEELKRFSLRDGMGAERIRKLANIDVGIISGENSIPLRKRAEKLEIRELHVGIKEKVSVVKEIMKRRNLNAREVAYIGDDVNDLEVLSMVGFSACPADALLRNTPSQASFEGPIFSFYAAFGTKSYPNLLARLFKF